MNMFVVACIATIQLILLMICAAQGKMIMVIAIGFTYLASILIMIAMGFR